LAAIVELFIETVLLNFYAIVEGKSS